MDPQALAIIIAAIAVGSFVKGVTGSGLPQIAIPVMAIFLGVERSVVVMAIPGLASNAWLIWRYRYHFRQTRDLPTLLATGIVGAIIGTWLLASLDPRLLAGILALLIFVYVGLRLFRPTLRLSVRTTKVLSPPVGLAAGTLQGATGMSGPLLTTWLHSYRHEPPVYVVSLVTLFQVFGVVQAGMLIALGLMTPSRAMEGTLALIPMVLALPAGAWFGRRMSTRTFDRWILLLLVGSAGKLVHSALWG